MPPDQLVSPPGGQPHRPVAARRRLTPVAVLLASITMVALVACGNEAAYEKVEPYELTETADGVNEVALTEKASERLKMETAPVTVAQGDLLTVPYAALIYDTNGETWVYQQTGPLSYKRVGVEVDYIEGDTVYLTAAPDEGTLVAVASVAELYGTDTGVGK